MLVLVVCSFKKTFQVFVSDVYFSPCLQSLHKS